MSSGCETELYHVRFTVLIPSAPDHCKTLFYPSRQITTDREVLWYSSDSSCARHALWKTCCFHISTCPATFTQREINFFLATFETFSQTPLLPLPNASRASFQQSALRKITSLMGKLFSIYILKWFNSWFLSTSLIHLFLHHWLGCQTGYIIPFIYCSIPYFIIIFVFVWFGTWLLIEDSCLKE